MEVVQEDDADYAEGAIRLVLQETTDEERAKITEARARAVGPQPKRPGIILPGEE